MEGDLTRCGFAAAGTYGHECGAPAVFVGVKKSDLTKSGQFYARRCATCRAIKGGENVGITDWVPFDPAVHSNIWR